MKNIAIKITAAALLSTISFCSCKKFDDMNNNPYALKVEQAPSETYIQNILYKTEYALCNVFRTTTAHLMQYAISTNSEQTSRIVANYTIAEATDDDIWTQLYIQYGDAVSMYEKAVKEKNPSTEGISLILRAMLMSLITDTYGNVPCTEAGQIHQDISHIKYTTAYDDQREIYRNIVKWFEQANECLSSPQAKNVPEINDYTFKGDINRWRRFGNALYLRTLMRISLKVEEESGGEFVYDTKTGDSIDIKATIAEMYNSFSSGDGLYPMMRGVEDCAKVKFDKYNDALNTPFYSQTSGNWNAVGACDVLVRRMLDTTPKNDKPSGITYYAYVPSSSGGHIEDPRFDHYWRKTFGAPTQLFDQHMKQFMEEQKSSAGNSKVGRMPNGDATSAITQKIYDLKNPDHYNLMNYSEQLFLFAEAGARGWVMSISGFGAYLDLFKSGITASILEWDSELKATDTRVVDFVNYIAQEEKFDGRPFDSANAVEAILTQKWISLYFVGTEAWNDYRRTGFPFLKTNGEAAENDNILPTRLRYPADEAYRNVDSFRKAVDGWLGGTNNMKTDVWWADNAISRTQREKGRQ